MALWKQFAMQALDEKKEQLKALQPEQQKAVIRNVLMKHKQNPAFVVDEGMVEPEVLDRIGKLKAVTEGEFQPKGVSATAGSDLIKENRIAELQSQGVVLDEEIPLESTWELGFGANPQQDLKKALSEHFGEDVRVVRDQGDFIYMHPKTKKLTKANLGIAADAGHGIPMAADVAGTYLVGGTSPGGAAGKQVLKETLGSGVFTTAGEGLRLVLGKVMGVHDMSFEEIRDKAVETGVEAAAFTGGIGATVAGVKGAYNFVKGGLFTADEAAKYGLNVDEANAIIEEVNEVLRKGGSQAKIKGTLAQKADDAQLASMETQARTSVEHGQRFATRTKEDQAAAAEALDVISKKDELGYDPLKMKEEDLPAMLREQAGPDMGMADSAPSVLERQAGITDEMLGRPKQLETVGDVARAKTGRRIEQAKGVVARNVEEFDTQLKAIGKTQKEAVGEPTADYIKLKRDTEKQAVDQAWESVKSVGKFNPEAGVYGIEIPQGELTGKLKAQFKRRTTTAQTRIAAGGTGAVYQPSKAGAQDLADLNREISDVKRELANIQKGRQRGTTSEKDLAEVVQAMVEDRRTALLKAGRKDVLDAIEAAERQTHNYHKTYTRSVVSDLMEETPSGAPVIKSQQFVDDMLKRDATEFDALADVIGDNMELVGQWREGIADAYKRVSFDEVTGKFNRKASERWYKTHGKKLEESGFFTGAELNAVRRTGQLSDKIAKQTKQLDAFIKKANNKWGSGALQKVDPEGLSNFITGKGGSWSTPSGRGVQERISKIKYVKNMTAEHPAAWRRVQNDFKQIIRDDIVDPATGRIKPNKIAAWSTDSENAKVVQEALGSTYLKNLQVINDAVKILNKKENRLTSGQAIKGAIQAIRAGVAPPLTQRGRALTAIITFSNASAQKRAADALLDDVTMKKTAELLKHNVHSRRFLEKAGSLGFMDFEETTENEGE